MSMAGAQPLSIANSLAPTPKNSPQFSTAIHLTDGSQVLVADPKATRAMVALMDMNALHGGAASHYGGPAAFAELMSATHGLMFSRATKAGKQWHQLFHFVNDAGHCENGLYALKANYGFADLKISDLKKFRSVESPLTGHGEAHLFPEGVLVSNGPLGSGLPQAQGLALADGLVGNKRTTICAISDGAAMEGEAKESFAAIPGLARRGRLAPFVMIISDNNTKLSGRIDQDAFSMQPSFKSLETLGWKVLTIEDGHQLQACAATLEEALLSAQNDPTTPVAIHARTIKGKGVKKWESSGSGAHGFPCKLASELPAALTEIYEGKTVPAEFLTWAAELTTYEENKAKNKSSAASASETGHLPVWKQVPSEKIQIGVAQAMIEARKAGLPVFSISADLPGSTGVADFQKNFADSTQDVGVAEANMVSTAVGMSLGGFIPVVDTFAQFGVTKGALPLTMASLSLGPVIGVFSHTGFQDAADGASHQALCYFAQVGGIPHVETYAVASSAEAQALMTQAIESFAADRRAGKVPPSRIFFLGRENFPRRFMPENFKYQLGRAQVVQDTVSGFSKSVVIAGVGSLLGEALKAQELLAQEKIGAIVINPSSINHPDLETFSASLARTGGRLITVEEHRLYGGFGATLTHQLVSRGESCKVRSLAVGDHFGQSAYNAIDLYRKHGLDSGAIVRAAKELCS